MPRVAVVTGSNKGIGFAIVRSLCKKLDSSDVVYLTSRKESLGLEAVKALQAEGVSPRYHQLDIADEESAKKLRDHLQETHGGFDILVNNAGILLRVSSNASHRSCEGPSSRKEGASPHYHQLDIADEESAKRLRDHLQESHGGFDILVNNAGILLREADLPMKEKVKRTLKTNYFDTMKAHYILMPLIRPHGRVVFVASGLGVAGYRQISDDLRKCFRDAKTEDDVNKLMQKYQSDVEKGIHAEAGWKAEDCGYNISKLGVIVATKVLADKLGDDPRQGILINSYCPGFVATDMTSHQGGRSTDHASVTALNLALLPSSATEPQGRYVDAHQKVKNFLEK